MAEISPSLSVVTLNVNGINSPIKRQRWAEWIKQKQKHDPSICSLENTHFRSKDINKLKVEKKRKEKIFHASTNQKGAGEVILRSYKMTLKRLQETKKVIIY